MNKDVFVANIGFIGHIISVIQFSFKKFKDWLFVIFLWAWILLCIVQPWIVQLAVDQMHINFNFMFVVHCVFATG